VTATALTRPPEPDHPLEQGHTTPDDPAALRDGGRFDAWHLGLLLVLALIGAHLVLAAFMRVPIIHPDELGYLDNARYLAHGGLRPETEYYPGYSLLLIPLWLASRDPLTVWRGALTINCVLAGLGGAITWSLCHRLVPTASSAARLAITALVCLYPPFLLYSNVALAECLFIGLFGVVVLVAARAFSGGGPRWWSALGLCTGALVMVHPRGLAVVVAVVLVAGVVLRPMRGRARALAGLALGAGLALSLGLTRTLVTLTRGAPAYGFAAYRPDAIVTKSLSLHGLVSLGWEVCGQMFYLSAATLGLLPLGLFLGLRSLRAVWRGDRTPTELARGFAALALLGVLALSSLFMNLGDRADKLVYGRYNEGVIVPLLIVALADVLAPGRLRRFTAGGYPARRWIVIGGGAIVLTGTGLVAGRSTAALHGSLNPINVLGLYPVLHREAAPIGVALVVAVSLALVVAIAAAAWRFPAVAAFALAAVFVFTALDAETSYLVPGSRARAAQTVIASALKRAAGEFGVGTDCIGYDPVSRTDFDYFATRFLLPDRLFRWFDAAHGAQPCGPLVVSGHADFGTHFPLARLVTLEDDVPQALWVLPGPLQDRMAKAGWLLPTATPGVLPDGARQARVTSSSAIATVASGGRTTTSVEVIHDGAGSPWPAAAGLKQGAFAVRLAVRWYSSGHAPPSAGDLGAPLATTHVELPRTLLPGDKATLSVPLVARDDKGAALNAGSYNVHLQVYQEGAPAFTDPGLQLLVTVR
jgi:hypothetical protein